MEASIHAIHSASNATASGNMSTSNPRVADTTATSAPAPATQFDSAAPVPPAGPSGGTAQTSGFAQAGTSPRSTSSPPPPRRSSDTFGMATQYAYLANAGGFSAFVGEGGGLASSPNVPKPGTSINPETGKPHTAGVTRAELEATKAKGENLPDPTPQEAERGQSSVKNQFDVPAGQEAMHTVEGRRLSDLSGREQAAKQLVGSTGEQAATPGQELPGGWGPVKPVAAPGTGPNATTSIYEDVTGALDKVGHAAFSLMPTGVKEALGTSPRRASTNSDPGTSPTARRGSAAALFEQVKAHGTKFAQDIQGTVASTGRRDFSFKPTTGRTSGTIGSEGGVFSHVKGFVQDVFAGPVATGEGQMKAVHETAIAPRTSLPSEEHAGALPGEHSSGAGALPGKNTESGVAVLPDEKKPAPTLPSQENQGMLPGETSGGVGALPGKLSEAGVALPPDVRKAEGTAGGFVSGSGASGAATPSTTALGMTGTTPRATTGTATPAGTTTATAAQPGTNLAPPLPQTRMFEGAARGATDLETTPAVTAPGSSASSYITSPTAAEATRHSNDRATSLASVTAIRDGTEGDRHLVSTKSSPLAGESITAGEAVTASMAGAGAGALAAQASTTRGTGPSHVTSLTPGNEYEGVGHPSTRAQEGATREPGTYPTPNHAGPAIGQSTFATPGILGSERAKSEEATDTPKSSTITGVGADRPTVGDISDRAAKGEIDIKPSTGGVAVAGAAGAAAGATGHGAVTDATHSTEQKNLADISPASTNQPITPQTPTTKLKDESAIVDHHGNGISGNGGNGRESMDTTTAVGSTAHRRSSSTASNGKKKVGFMKKLKGEIKVISGKMANDQEKVDAGERIKHGEVA